MWSWADFCTLEFIMSEMDQLDTVGAATLVTGQGALPVGALRTLASERQRAEQVGGVEAFATSEFERDVFEDERASLLQWLPARAPILIGVGLMVLVIALGLSIAARGNSCIPSALTPRPVLNQTAGLTDLPPPEITPTAYADYSPVAAAAWNASFPIDPGPNAAAKPFRIVADPTLDYGRALDCLTAAIHYEAASEGPDGMRAVAQVVLNRVRHPAFPHSVCEVVFQGAELKTGCQFTFTCDGSLDRAPNPAAWAAARQVAATALSGYVFSPVGNATHYHTQYVVPKWAPQLSKIGNVGAHIFYKWKGVWGQPAAFSSAYRPEVDVKMLYRVGNAPFRNEEPLKALLDAPTVMAVAHTADDKPIPPPPPAPVAEKQLVAGGPVKAESALDVASPSVAVPETPRASTQPDTHRPANPLAEQPKRRARIAAPSGW